MKEKEVTIPAIALRGMTILPGMIAHFDISRERSLKAIEASMVQEQNIFLVTQMDAEKEEPKEEDLYSFGIIARIKQVIKLQKGIIRILVEGTNRARILEFTEQEAYFEAQVLPMEEEEELPLQVEEAMVLSVQESFLQFV